MPLYVASDPCGQPFRCVCSIYIEQAITCDIPTLLNVLRLSKSLVLLDVQKHVHNMYLISTELVVLEIELFNFLELRNLIFNRCILYIFKAGIESHLDNLINRFSSGPHKGHYLRESFLVDSVSF